MMTPSRLRRIIQELQTTQAQLAYALGVPDRQVRRWLTGNRGIPEEFATTLELLVGDKTMEDIVVRLTRRVEDVQRLLNRNRRQAPLFRLGKDLPI